jgi:ABC-type transport system involved in cytochrome c biogenesis permease subunit
MAELLVWPALLAYGEAAVAYAGSLRGLGMTGRLGIWGVRLGWVAQTALLVVQALRADGFPWGTWAGALNLFVWLVVGAYLVWGCNARFRLLGLMVMPPAAALLLASWAGGGTESGGGVHSGVVLGAHVGLMLAALAGLTVSAGMAALYLWEERRLKQRDSRLFRLRVPPLEALDRIAARAAAISLGLLSGGIVLGLARLRSGRFDAAMAVTLGLWLLVAAVLALRREAGLRGRRAATLLVAVFALIVVVLPITHFAS